MQMPKPIRVIGTTSLYKGDLESLEPMGWLTGSTINAFLALVNELPSPAGANTYCFSTYFYPKYRANGLEGVRRWSHDVDLQSKDMLLFPIHLHGNHWSLVVVRLPSRTIYYYDSLDFGGKAPMQTIKKYLIERLQVKGLTVEAKPKCWRQHNPYDCGVHLCRTAFLLAIGESASIYVESTGDTKRFRQKIRRSLLARRIK